MTHGCCAAFTTSRPWRVSARRSYRLCYKSKRASDEAIRVFGRWIKSELPEFLASSGNIAAIRG